MENLKSIRWKQRFEYFEKSFRLLEIYSSRPITNEIEKAGMIQFFEVSLMPYKFDIISYNDIKSKELIKHIDEEGIVLYLRYNII